MDIGAALIAAGIGFTALVLPPGAPVLVAAVGWSIGGLGMGLAYSMLALLALETAPPGEDGVSAAALQLMFTLGTAFGAGAGGAVVALADAGTLDLVTALWIVNGAIVLVRGPAGACLWVRRAAPELLRMEHADLRGAIGAPDTP